MTRTTMAVVGLALVVGAGCGRKPKDVSADDKPAPVVLVDPGPSNSMTVSEKPTTKATTKAVAEKKAVEPEKPEPVVNGKKDVWSEFFTNAAKADGTYTGKLVRVEVVVTEVEKSKTHAGKWVLVGTMPGSPNNGLHLCRFDTSAEVGKTEVGHVVRIVGRVFDWKDRTLYLTDCKVVWSGEAGKQPKD